LEPAFLGPDITHFWTGISRNHGFNTFCLKWG
jgi:hypothetical protein